MLVIKKKPYAELHNEIGKIFREHNIMEYKSPKDSLNINTFYKVIGYACLYKAYGGVANEIKAYNITISLVRESKPKKLFRYFKNRNIKVTMPYMGIYYIHGISPFHAQIIAANELKQEEHMWVKALTDKMKRENMEKLIEKSVEISDEYEREFVEAILEVT